MRSRPGSLPFRRPFVPVAAAILLLSIVPVVPQDESGGGFEQGLQEVVDRIQRNCLRAYPPELLSQHRERQDGDKDDPQEADGPGPNQPMIVHHEIPASCRARASAVPWKKNSTTVPNAVIDNASTIANGASP